MEQKRVWTSLEKALSSRMIIDRPSVDWNSKVTWLENAKRAQQPPALFAGVIAGISDKKYEFKTWREFADDAPVTTDRSIPANASSLAKAGEVLVSSCQEFHLIDPYLDIRRDNVISVVREFVGTAAKYEQCESIVLWLKQDVRNNISAGNPDFRRIAQSLIHEFSWRVRLRLRLKFVSQRQPGTAFHGRYLLTLHGSLRYDQGFQSLPNRSMDVSIVGRDRHMELRRNFIGPPPNQKSESIEVSAPSPGK